MNTYNRKEIRWFDGTSWSPGTEISVRADNKTPVFSFLTNVLTGQIKKIRTLHLCFYFAEFIPVSEDMLTEALMDGDCPSLTGQEVDPDGWDKEGFPSILLAAGLI